DDVRLIDLTVPWQDLDHQELVARITATFRALPAKSRRLLYWREVEGLSPTTIAERLGTSPGVVATGLTRARARFRREYLRLHRAGVLDPTEEIFDDPTSLLACDPLTPAADMLGAVHSRVRTYFDQIAPSWESYVATAYETHLATRLGHLLPWRPGMRVLDVGTGTGYLARILAPSVGEVIGVDVSPGMLRQAGERSPVRDHPNLVLREGTAERLPVETGAGDVVLCHMLMHHVVSPRQVLRELRRVVRPGGALVIVDADRHDLPWTIAEFGDVHKGTDRRRLQRHLPLAGFAVERVEDAGISDSGATVGRPAVFTNFLLLGRADRA
ncbi:MAG: methyltransferase domain-containing protein, partial [Thermomicrobiales bacterium]